MSIQFPIPVISPSMRTIPISIISPFVSTIPIFQIFIWFISFPDLARSSIIITKVDFLNKNKGISSIPCIKIFELDPPSKTELSGSKLTLEILSEIKEVYLELLLPNIPRSGPRARCVGKLPLFSDTMVKSGVPLVKFEVLCFSIIYIFRIHLIKSIIKQQINNLMNLIYLRDCSCKPHYYMLPFLEFSPMI